ncbi:type II toxin-antitoxin system mRNA interferase toxin, RelE/StbE family [Candidatus Fermentibacteria bacterium]|nr:MAG: type II toxin-antitoxin system mRNA interferase toxin, RelE/StbE family [Candidatus Fermentibacteria bacterium]
MTYSIEFRPGALKNLKRFPKRDLVRIRKRIEELRNSLPDSQITKMSGKNSFHRVRSRNYRIIYEIHSDRLIILIVKVAHRRDVYRNLT